MKNKKTFRFHAQQGQAALICRLLTTKVAKPKVVKTDKGFMITVELPKGISKRSVDRMLHAAAVPGASSRRNKYPVIAGEHYDLVYNDKAREAGVFHWSHKGKFMGKHEVYYHDFGCTCCGGFWNLKPVKRS